MVYEESIEIIEAFHCCFKHYCVDIAASEIPLETWNVRREAIEKTGREKFSVEQKKQTKKKKERDETLVIVILAKTQL